MSTPKIKTENDTSPKPPTVDAGSLARGSASFRWVTPEESAALYITSAPGLTIRKPIRANFVAQPDITAYELAQTLPFFFGQPMFQEDFDKLEASQRHWQVSPNVPPQPLGK